MTEQDPTENRVTITAGEGSISFDQTRLHALDKETQRAFVRDLSHVVLTGEMGDDAVARFEQVGGTIASHAQDGSVEQATMIGSGLAAEEHLPPR